MRPAGICAAGARPSCSRPKLCWKLRLDVSRKFPGPFKRPSSPEREDNDNTSDGKRRSSAQLFRLDMSRPTICRQLAKTLFRPQINCAAPQTRCAAMPFTRSFSSSSPRLDEDQIRDRENRLKDILPLRTRPQSPAKLEELARTTLQSSGVANAVMGRAVNDSRRVDTGPLSSWLDSTSIDQLPSKNEQIPEPYHFHIYSHKHNTHVTVTKPSRDPIVSLSCGNLGFRKSNRKHYDAAYQLGAYVIDKLQQQGWHNKIDTMEVSLRGFGPGREAVTKVLLGTEGKLLRQKITKVSDSTRLKFGGTRSKRPRRL